MNVRSTTTPGGWSVGGIAGLLGVALPAVGVAVLPIWSFPGTHASASEITTFVSVHRTALQAVMVLNTLGVSLWMVFGAAVVARWRRGSADEGLLLACFAAGLISLVTLLLAGFVAFDVLVYRAPGPSEARLLYYLTFGLLAMSGMPTAVALGAYALAISRGTLLPWFTGVLAAVAAAGHVALLLSFVVPDGWLSLEGQVITVVPALLFLWIFATAVAMRGPFGSVTPDQGRRPCPTP